jgi:hypothetical protein
MDAITRKPAISIHPLPVTMVHVLCRVVKSRLLVTTSLMRSAATLVIVFIPHAAFLADAIMIPLHSAPTIAYVFFRYVQIHKPAITARTVNVMMATHVSMAMRAASSRVHAITIAQPFATTVHVSTRVALNRALVITIPRLDAATAFAFTLKNFTHAPGCVTMILMETLFVMSWKS